MSRLPWHVGNRHCPSCGQSQWGRLWWWVGRGPDRLPGTTWRCHRCNALLGYDFRRWSAMIITIICACIIAGATYFIKGWPFWVSVAVVFVFSETCALWFLSVVLKKEEGEKIEDATSAKP